MSASAQYTPSWSEHLGSGRRAVPETTPALSRGSVQLLLRSHDWSYSLCQVHAEHRASASHFSQQSADEFAAVCPMSSPLHSSQDIGAQRSLLRSAAASGAAGAITLMVMLCSALANALRPSSAHPSVPKAEEMPRT